MLHAKTAIADDHWARSVDEPEHGELLGNYELDVAIEDEAVRCADGGDVRGDIERATEIVLTAEPHPRASDGPRSASALLGAGSARVPRQGPWAWAAVGAALTNRRTLGPTEASSPAVAFVLLAVAVLR